MAFDVSTFKSKMTGDGARPNLFQVTLSGASEYFTSQGLEAEFFIRATSIPGATLGSVIVPYFGREVKFAGNRTFADWSVTVINDENFKVRSALEAWMDNINRHEANVRNAESINGYYGFATVQQLSKKSPTEDIRAYHFENIFPVDLSEITLDWGDNDSIEEFTCTFAYDYWTANIGTLPESGGATIGS
tara:strand:+ start:2454 stop:3023 length:570 start_codon:yes stop_codon:yes gene_type:complete